LLQQIIPALLLMAPKLPGVVVVPLVAAARNRAVARPSEHRRQQKTSTRRWRIILQATLLQQLPLPLLDVVT
jgi:hypothetical protein